MANKILSNYVYKNKRKRPGKHSKNASKGQTAYKKKYIGQGKRR